jgi:nucleoside-diphosphate-sugar epimerase
MKILLTGAFGNIGRNTATELLQRGHELRCFDIKTKASARHARQIGREAEIFWGDLRRPADVRAAVAGCDAVVHLAFVIPRLSTTGVNSEDDPAWAHAVNVGGTRNLLAAMQVQPAPPRLLFTSSFHIYGKTQHQPPPRTLADEPRPVEHYARHKLACEQMVRASGLSWTIFRLAAALPVRLVLDPGMFDVPLDNRIEFVHSRDVALAIANALEEEQVWGRTWHIGGGPRCQLYQRELVSGVLDAVGVGMLPEEAFTTTPYPTDWLDTTESEQLLHFQRYTLQDYIQDVTEKVGYRRRFIQLFRPAIRAWLLSERDRAIAQAPLT